VWARVVNKNPDSLEQTSEMARHLGILMLLLLGAAVDQALAGCGNELLETGESCDDGNTAAGDGCSAACTIECGFTCSAWRSGFQQSCALTCGDGITMASEQCDDGNTEAGDGCSENCREISPSWSCVQLPPEEGSCGGKSECYGSKTLKFLRGNMGTGDRFEAGQELRPVIRGAMPGTNVTVRLQCIFERETAKCLQGWLVGDRSVMVVRTARNGSIAEFNLHITYAGSAYILAFSTLTDGAGAQAVSQAFTVHGAAPTELKIVRPPEPSAQVHTAILGNPSIAAYDRFGNAVVGVRIKTEALLVDSPYLENLISESDLSVFVAGDTLKETEVDGIATFGNIVMTQTGNYTITWSFKDQQTVRTTPLGITSTPIQPKVIQFLINEDWTTGWVNQRGNLLRTALGKICKISPLYFRIVSAVPAKNMPGYLVSAVETAIPAARRRMGESSGELEIQGDRTLARAEAEQQLVWDTLRPQGEGVQGDIGGRRKFIRYPDVVAYITVDMNPLDGRRSELLTAGVRGVLFEDGKGLGKKFEIPDSKDDVSKKPAELSIDTKMLSLVMSTITGGCVFVGAVTSLTMSIGVCHVEKVALSSDFFFVRQVKVASIMMIEQLQYLGLIERIGNGLETEYMKDLAQFSDGFNWAHLRNFKMLPRFLGNRTRTESELTAEEIYQIQCEDATNEWLVVFLTIIVLASLCFVSRVSLLLSVDIVQKKFRQAQDIPFMLRPSAWSGPALLVLSYGFFGACSRAICGGCLGPTLLSAFLGLIPFLLLFGSALYQIKSTEAFKLLHARIVLTRHEEVPYSKLQRLLWTFTEQFEQRFPDAVVTEDQERVFLKYGWFFEDWCYRAYHWGALVLLKKLILVFLLELRSEKINITCVMFLLGVDALLFLLVRPYFRCECPASSAAATTDISVILLSLLLQTLISLGIMQQRSQWIGQHLSSTQFCDRRPGRPYPHASRWSFRH
jgi:cysteine-rich repeat protein